jgi:TonB family protein
MPRKPACGTTELGGNILPPRKLKDVRPRYKAEWNNAGLTGEVLLHAVIGVDGKVRNVEVVSPVSADLEDEAVLAVSQWEFSPTWLNCEAIEVRMFVTVKFTN